MAGLLACWLLLLTLTPVRPLAMPDEGRYAEISRWMLHSGDWLVPRLNGLPFFHKPPLLHWLQALAMAVLGVHPWVARLVPVLAAGLMLGGLLLAGQRLLGAAVARRAGWMLALSPAFLLGGQYINHDMLVASWIATAIWCFALAFDAGDRPHAGWARAGFAACALGLLTKGLIGVVLPGMVLFFWLTATRRWRQVPRLPWFSGVALFLAIAAPWFVLAGQHYPRLWAYLFGFQQFTRFTSSGFNNQQPWWYYLAGLALLLCPWPLWLRWARPEAGAERRRARDAALLCWIWLVAITLFFSIPRSKLIGYILPVLPPLALLAALGWERAMAHRPHAGRGFAALALLPLGVSLAVTFGYQRWEGHKLSGDMARTLACRVAPEDTVYVLGGFPYDLPFVAQTTRPLVVLQDWAHQRQSGADNWRQELLDAGDFEPARAAELLRTPDVLVAAARQPRRWLLAPRQPADDDERPPPGWHAVADSTRWTLWRSDAAGAEGAPAARLPGCQDEGLARVGPASK